MKLPFKDISWVFNQTILAVQPQGELSSWEETVNEELYGLHDKAWHDKTACHRQDVAKE